MEATCLDRVRAKGPRPQAETKRSAGKGLGRANERASTASAPRTASARKPFCTNRRKRQDERKRAGPSLFQTDNRPTQVRVLPAHNIPQFIQAQVIHDQVQHDKYNKCCRYCTATHLTVENKDPIAVRHLPRLLYLRAQKFKSHMSKLQEKMHLV